jgi:hypothetical protein
LKSLILSHRLKVYVLNSNQTTVGKSVSEQDIEEMMASADVDGDGLINFEEFLKIMVCLLYNYNPSNTLMIHIDINPFFFLDSLQSKWHAQVLNKYNTIQ